MTVIKNFAEHITVPFLKIFNSFVVLCYIFFFFLTEFPEFEGIIVNSASVLLQTCSGYSPWSVSVSTCVWWGLLLICLGFEDTTGVHLLSAYCIRSSLVKEFTWVKGTCLLASYFTNLIIKSHVDERWLS